MCVRGVRVLILWINEVITFYPISRWPPVELSHQPAIFSIANEQLFQEMCFQLIFSVNCVCFAHCFVLERINKEMGLNPINSESSICKFRLWQLFQMRFNDSFLSV